MVTHRGVIDHSDDYHAMMQERDETFKGAEDSGPKGVEGKRDGWGEAVSSTRARMPPALALWKSWRTFAAHHRGVVIAVPVFWAAVAAFIHPWWAFAGFAIHSTAVLPRRVPTIFALLLAGPLLTMWFAAREPHLSGDHAPFHQRFHEEKTESTRTGVVASIPATTARGIVFLFRERTSSRERGRLFRISLEGDIVNAPAWGATVKVVGRAAPEAAPPNPGQLDMRRVLKGQGASASIKTVRCETIASPPLWKQWLTRGRAALAASLNDHVPAPARPLLEASLLNITQNVPEETREAFFRSGMQHILAISGQHIGLLIGFLLMAGVCIRLPRKTTFVIAALLTAAYIPLVGSPVSVVRSGIMFACLLPAIILERPSVGLHALGLTITADLLFDPHNILNLGFQLSYAATLALILGARPALEASHALHTRMQTLLLRCVFFANHARMIFIRRIRRDVDEPENENNSEEPNESPTPKYWGSGMVSATLQMILLSGLITLFTYPVLATSTHVITPWGVLGNVIAVPVGAGMLIGGLFTWSLDFLLPAPLDTLASAAGATAGLCAVFLEGLVFQLANLPGALKPIAHPPDAWLAVLFCGGLITAMVFRSGRYVLALFCGLLIVAAEAARPTALATISGESRITFLAVGHGDAAVLELPGAVILIDAGDAPRIARNIIVPFLHYRGISRLDAVMITHPDLDHYGGVAALLDRIPVDFILGPPEANGEENEEDPSVTWKCLGLKARTLGIPWIEGRAGQSVYTGRRDSLWILAPDTANPALAGADKNDRSLVALLRSPRTDVLFTGDIEHAGQRALAETWPLWRGAWLKAPHHGSDRTTMPCFLNAVSAPRAVVSCGGRRGFPGPHVMETFAERGTRTSVTKHRGAVTWTFHKSGSHETHQFTAEIPDTAATNLRHTPPNF